MKKYCIYIFLFTLLVSCNVTKRVPNGSYLLDKVKIDTDTKYVKSSELKPFLRQKPNSSIPIIGKWKLMLYSMAGNDSTWSNRQMRKWGEPPVLFSERLTGISMEQIRLELKNRGYLHAEVDTTVVKKDKKAKVTYEVTGHDPYLIRNYKDTIASVDSAIYKILKDEKRLKLIAKGDLFDLKVLDKNRSDITRVLRNSGYYNFPKENLYFLADTTVGNHQVDLTLGLNNPTDSTNYKPYYMRLITVYNDVDEGIRNEHTAGNYSQRLDTAYYRNLRVISKADEKFLTTQSIYYNTFIRPGKLYSDKTIERTYSSLNNLGSVSQTNINLFPILKNDSNFIDTQISIYPGALHYMQFGVDGTNSAGDLGIASNVMYEHRNLFHGGERLRVTVNGAYEFISKTDSTNLLDRSYYEYGSEVSLMVPQLLFPWILKSLKDQPLASTEFAIGANFQKRPEYLRQFFNLSSRFYWTNFDFRLSHVLEPLSINYVRMPWKSQRFVDEYLSGSNAILRYSYDDQFIVLSSYRISFTNATTDLLPKYPFRARAGIEVAGHLPSLITALGGSKKNEDGFYEIWKTPYAEYVKGDFDIAPTFPITPNDVIAAHFALGIGYPYGNSVVLPFEKRYFAGGANSVRGWSTRTLGPGSYVPDSVGYDFGNQVGDIKLDMSIEYRRKLSKLFELASFIDAGNIWTIKPYERQPMGDFRWNRFYKEIAMSYGVGLRVNLNFLLLRADFGMKAYNPALPSGQKWTIFKPELRRDFAWHFAIGYPF